MRLGPKSGKPPVIEAFPVVVPMGFKPFDLDKDGADIRWDKKECPCQDAEDGYMPRWGGGYYAPRGRHLHRAIDIMAAEGTPVVAMSNGFVPERVHLGRGSDPGAGTRRKSGNYVVLLDDNGNEWYFAHLALPPNVHPGQEVEAGDLLGYVGRTGNAARRYGDGSKRGCPHLHLRGKDSRGVYFDPLHYLREPYEAGGWKWFIEMVGVVPVAPAKVALDGAKQSR